MKIFFIVNPNSSNGAAGRMWPRIREGAKKRLGKFESCLTSESGHASVLAQEALSEGARLLICVGGDGTLNEVINGFMRQNKGDDSEVLIGYIPVGTGCDFIRSVPIPREPEKALDIISLAQYRHFDLGKVTYNDKEGNRKSAYFHNVLSFGLGGEVDARVNRTTKVFGGFVSFIWATLISILRYNIKHINLNVNGSYHLAVAAWNIAIANGQYHGGGMWVAPGADPADGLFQVTIVGELNKAQLFINLHKLYNGRIYSHKKITRLTCKCIEAWSSQQVFLDMDGEQPGSLPAEIEIVPSALPIICPS